MSTLVIVLHVIACLGLILIVLLQTGKGANVGAAFGGSSQTVFGSSGAVTFLAKITTLVAVLFMLTSLSLAFFAQNRGPESVMQNVVPTTQQSDAAPAAPSQAPAEK